MSKTSHPKDKKIVRDTLRRTVSNPTGFSPTATVSPGPLDRLLNFGRNMANSAQLTKKGNASKKRKK